MIVNEEYELTVIWRGSLEAKDHSSETTRLTKLISDLDGKVPKSEATTKKGLAYAIKREKEGYYLFSDISIPRAKVAELRSKLALNESVLRYLIVQKERDRRQKS